MKPFDHIATQYDTNFTHSAIGQLQRKQVWAYLEKIIPDLRGLDMLELNCGTGEDALMFSERGFNIMATDVSAEMLKITEKKARQYSMQHSISSKYLDLESFDATVFDKKFDLVFSNFGGLNCISPASLNLLLQKIPSILNPGGRFIAVVMPRFCLWESAYFFFQFKLKSMARRWTAQEVNSVLLGVNMKIWYYNPAQLKRYSHNHFRTIASMPIGLVLPPSYLERFFAARLKLLNSLNAIDGMVNKFSIGSAFADHYLIDLKLK